MTEKSCPEEVYEPLRISQLDAAELDHELTAIVKSQLLNVFKYLKPGLLTALAPELDAVLRLLVWQVLPEGFARYQLSDGLVGYEYSVKKNASTVGQEMLDLCYIDESQRSISVISNKQRWLLAVLTVCGSWLEARHVDIASWTAPIGSFSYITRCIKLISVLWKIADLVNFLVFLTRGHYGRLVERILRIHSVFRHRQAARQVGFELMDREILWHGFAEFLFFILPFINFRKVKNFIQRRLISTAANNAENHLATSAIYQQCVVCTEWPVLPHSIENCPHVFCYYCVMSNYKADINFQCPICCTNVVTLDSIRPVVLSDISSDSRLKTSD